MPTDQSNGPASVEPSRLSLNVGSVGDSAGRHIGNCFDMYSFSGPMKGGIGLSAHQGVPNSSPRDNAAQSFGFSQRLSRVRLRAAFPAVESMLGRGRQSPRL